MKQEGPLAHLLLISTKRETGGFSEADCWQPVQESVWEPKKQTLVSQETSVSGLRIPAPEPQMFSVHRLKKGPPAPGPPLVLFRGSGATLHSSRPHHR